MLPNSATAVVSPDHPAEPLVLDGLGKRYGRGAFVLRGLSARFEPGTATAIVGPNGAGKSTLLRLLTGQAFPSEGTARYGETDIHAHPYRYLAHIGTVQDGSVLPEHLSAEEAATYVLRARTGAADEAHAAAVLDAVRLDERRSEPIGAYSTGMRQKAQLAVALAPRPPVLLLDEPFRGLDIETTEAVLALLVGFKQAGGLLLFSSHRPEVHAALADDRLVLG